jgi:hypothetical protein
VSADIIPFPPQGKRCKTCGFVIVLKSGEAERERCFCCERGIPLPLSWDNPCPDCSGTGKVAVHVCRNEKECPRKCPQEQQCVACLGKGHKE